jgi:hypothetical protein
MKVVFVVAYVPLPLTVCVNAGLPEQVVSLGSYRLNVMVPPAVLVAPDNVMSSFGIRCCAVVTLGCNGSTTHRCKCCWRADRPSGSPGPAEEACKVTADHSLLRAASRDK